MFCENCGREIGNQSVFCGFCGAPVTPAAPVTGPPGEPAAATTPTQPPPPPQAPPPPPPASVAAAPPMGITAPAAAYGPAPYGPVKKKSALPWILGGIGILAVIAVVLVLALVVFKGGGGASDAEKVVGNFYKALEKQDVDMLLETMEPDFVDEIKDILGKDYRDLFGEFFFLGVPSNLKFNIGKYNTQVKGNEAKIKVVEGTMSYTDENGEKVTKQASEGDVEIMELVKISGKWYLSRKTLEDSFGFDLSGLEDYYLNDNTGLDDTNLNDNLTNNDYGAEDITLPVDSEDEVLTLVLDVPEVWSWYMEVENPRYEITDENTSYVIHLFEIVYDNGSSHTATLGWYAVDKQTGEVYEVVE